MIDILNYFFSNALHYILLCILVVLICPWHWTSAKKHIIEFKIPQGLKAQAKKEEQETIHVDKP